MYITKGFTLLELVMVILIVSVLGIVAVPRLNNIGLFQAQGFADQFEQTLRYAQKSAIAHHRLVCVNISTNSVSLTVANLSTDSSCSLNLILPERNSNALSIPTGISISPTMSLTFNALGQANSYVTFTVSNASHAIIVEQETGYVHD
jgi:MSHA pilin protein MshC